MSMQFLIMIHVQPSIILLCCTGCSTVVEHHILCDLIKLQPSGCAMRLDYQIWKILFGSAMNEPSQSEHSREWSSLWAEICQIILNRNDCEFCYPRIYSFIEKRFTAEKTTLPVNIYLFGFLAGFGVLFGDLVESFFKRRLDIAPGKSFFPWDQIDSVLGGLLFISIVYLPPWHVVVTLIVLTLVLHISIRHIGYYLGIEKSKW